MDTPIGGMAPKLLSPSTLARFYFHECERFLRYATVPRDHRASEGVPEPPYDPRPVTRAILESGARWEEEVIGDLLPEGSVHIAHGDGDLSDRIFDQDEARARISDLKAGEYVYQPSLDVPATFNARYGLSDEVVRWTLTRPDLIAAFETEDGLELRVIDIKATTGVKLSHRIQATVYSLILESALGEWGAADRTVSDQGGIWLAQHSEPEYFELRMLRPPIEQFLEYELQPLLAQPAAAAPWHLYFRCEWCEWFEHCREEMRATDSVSRIPYLTSHAKRFLASGDPPVETVEQFGELLSSDEPHLNLDDCASLRGKRTRVQTQVAALKKEQVMPHGGASLAMPRLENVRLVLTAQQEPVSGQLYAWGLYGQGLREVLGENRLTIRIAPDGDLDTIVELQRDLARQLWDVLSAVHDYNVGRDWKERKSLQAFVFDTYERQLVVETLLERLSDQEVAEQALKVLFQLQGPDLLQAEEHPANEVFFPMIALSEILRDRLALPTEISYRFADAVSLLQPEEYGFTYSDSDYFSFELSNQLRSDAIYGVWYEDKYERLDWIEKEIQARLYAANSLVNGTREQLEKAGALFAYPPKFSLPASFEYSSPLLSRLAFLAQYESVLRYLDVRNRRMAPVVEQVRSGDAVVLRWLGGDEFAVREISEDTELEPDNFSSRLLAERSADGRRALLGFDDYWNRERPWVRKGLKLRLASITRVEGSPATNVRLDLKAGPDSPELKRDVDYVLCPRFTDFTTSHAIKALLEIDEDPSNPDFVDLLTDPTSFAQPTHVDAAVRTTAVELAVEHGMTQSQLDALEGTLDRRLRLVWGPPGTGKTHFLALAILCLAEAHRRHGLPLRVLLTAFTHAAIENALRKIDALQAKFMIVEGGLPLGKLNGAVGNAGATTHDVARDGGDGWLGDREHAVLGGTVWALRRTEPESADMLVIDEGSQVLIPSAAVAIRRLARDGRLLIAGDDRQLPPIVLGTYPEPEKSEPLLHRSIFECLRRADAGGELTSMLFENWRMNETLCRYPRQQVYASDYASATHEISARRLALGDDDQSSWAEAIIDAEFPLVVCVLEGVRATAENAIEAGLVADCTEQLRSRLLGKDGKPYPNDRAGDEAFWKDGLFIVSPHHAQIRAIRKELDARRDWAADPFVNTVDKMQGQECDAVIVSYGVSDVEYALSESEFIYSLNRLNVSITRARAKTIVFLPLPLLEPPVAAFDDDRIAEGIAFMQGLWRFAEQEGEQLERSLGNGAAVLTNRVPTL